MHYHQHSFSLEGEMAIHFSDTSHPSQFLKSILIQSFSEHVSDHFFSTAVFQFHVPTADVIPADEVVLDCNVFASPIVLGHAATVKKRVYVVHLLGCNSSTLNNSPLGCNSEPKMGV